MPKPSFAPAMRASRRAQARTWQSKRRTPRHPELVLPDRVHPNARAIELVAAAFLPAVLVALGYRDQEAVFRAL